MSYQQTFRDLFLPVTSHEKKPGISQAFYFYSANILFKLLASVCVNLVSVNE